MAKAKKMVALKKRKKVLSDKQKQSAKNFYQEFFKKQKWGGYMNDGEIRIGTSIDLKGLEKELARSKKKLEQYDKDTEKFTNKKAKLEIDVSKTEADLQKLDVKFKELDNQKKELERINDRGLLESGRAPDSTKYAEIINQMEYINKKDLEYSDRLNYIKDQQEQIKIT